MTDRAFNRLSVGSLRTNAQKSNSALLSMDVHINEDLTPLKAAQYHWRGLKQFRSDMVRKAILICPYGQSNSTGQNAAGYADLVAFPANAAYIKAVTGGTNPPTTSILDQTVTHVGDFASLATPAVWFGEYLQILTAAMGVNGGTGIIPIFFDIALGGTPLLQKNATALGFYLEPETAAGAAAGQTSQWTLRLPHINDTNTILPLNSGLEIVRRCIYFCGLEADVKLSNPTTTTEAEFMHGIERMMMHAKRDLGIDAMLLNDVGTRGSNQVDVELQEVPIAIANSAINKLADIRPDVYKTFTYNGRYGTGPFDLDNLVVDGDGVYVSGTALIVEAEQIHLTKEFNRAKGRKSAVEFLAQGGLDGYI